MSPPLPPVSPPIHKYTILLASLAVAVQDRASEVSSRGPFSSVHPQAPDPPFDGGEDPFREIPSDPPRRLAAPAEKKNTSEPELLLRPLDTFAEESVRGVQRSL